MRSRVVQATRERGCTSIDGQQRMATLRLLVLAVIATPNRVAEDVSASGGCKKGWREGDRSGRPCDPATIEDVVPGHPAEAWTAMLPERPWEARVERRGHLTRLEPPLPRRVGNAEDARKVTADGKSHSAWTRDSHAEVLLPWTPERLDSRQQRLGVRAVPRWRADGA